MYTNFILGLILSRLKYAYKSNRGYVNIPNSRYVLSVIDFLFNKGFIKHYTLIPTGELIVYLQYYEGRCLFNNFKIVSKPSKRVYMSYTAIRSNLLKRRLVVVSTTRGLMTSLECVSLKLGGEILFELF